MDFSAAKAQESENYRLFVEIIDSADEIFSHLKRTDIPYYIFVDELEAILEKKKYLKGIYD